MDRPINGRVARRRQVVRHRNPFLPRRPTKATSGYGIFLKTFWGLNYGGNANRVASRDGIRAASQEWRNLPEAQKIRYNDQARPGQEQYTREVTAWKATRRALRRPASAYALFLQETWVRERGSGRSVGQMGRYAAGLWREMTAEQKGPYRTQFIDLTQRYKSEQRRIRAGLDLNVNWRTDAFPFPDAGDEAERFLDELEQMPMVEVIRN